MLRYLFVFGLILGSVLRFELVAQNASLSNELIWGGNSLHTERVGSFSFQNDGRHYTRFRAGILKSYDILGEEEPREIFNVKNLKLPGKEDVSASKVSWGPQEASLIIETDKEKIYRRSYKANYFIHHQKTEQSMMLDPAGKQMYPTFDPAGKRVAYVRSNNLYMMDTETGERTQLTRDGKWNEVINGAADWAYEEELYMTRAFEWSPNSQYIAYIRFDETEVPEFSMKYYEDGIYPRSYSFKYPKVSQPNSQVKVRVYDVINQGTLDLLVPEMKDDFYIPRIKWIPETNELIVFYLNRLQNELTLMAYDVQKGTQRVLLQETNERYISIHDHLTFIPAKQQFIWMTEKDGWRHLYLYDYRGKEVRCLSEGEWDVTDFYGYNPENQKVYLQAASKSALQREILTIDINTSKVQVLDGEMGWNTALFSPDFKVYIHGFETMNQPPLYSLKNEEGEVLRTLISNDHLRTEQEYYQVAEMQPYVFTNRKGERLNGFVIKPESKDPGKKYPVLMHLYGGPNSQQVTHRFKGNYYWWFQMMVKQGYIVACVDNRGTGARGEDFRKQTYLQLGKLETEDQIDAAEELSEWEDVDPERISIFGWSYGGYLSSLSLLKGNDVFNAAVAVAPVTNWKWYDSIYTERYMRRYEENPEGYDQNAPMFIANQLKGSFLLIHGLADDNVHFQHSAELMNALMHNNKQFESYVYPNEDHSISGGYLRVHVFNKITSFLNQNLKS